MADQAGLQELEERRARRTRQVPKPQHNKANITSNSTSQTQPPPAPRASAKSDMTAPTKLAQVDSAPEPDDALPMTPRRRSRLRQTQVHLDDRADGHLTELKKRAVMGEVDLSASAVLRRALEEYVEHHGYDGIVAWFAQRSR